MKKIIVAVDGYSSCGKSTIARRLAQRYGYKYVDTGAMYRAVGLAAIRAGILTDCSLDEQALYWLLPGLEIGFEVKDGVQHTTLDGADVEADIRTLAAGNAASRVSALGPVRARLTALQQAMGRERGIVMDGRDIGTAVFPDAELKIFVTARAEVRARRRCDELAAKGTPADYEAVLADLRDRDYRDIHRDIAPLRQASDALLLDNSDLSLDDQQRIVETWMEQRTRE